MKKLAAVFALAALAGWGASKERNGERNGEKDWQSAKLLDPDRTKYFANESLDPGNGRPGFDTSVRSASGYNSVANPGPAALGVHDYYIVETQGMVYLTERIRLKSSPPAKLAYTRPVKFFVEKNKLYLLNEDGDEYQTKIVKQVEREKER